MHSVRDGSRQPGLFVIDPHKDLIDDLLLLIPAGRAKDVVLFDLTNTQYVLALNPLDATMGFTRDQAVANLMACFERIWSDFWGPRMAYFLKAICLFLYTLNQQKVRQGQADQQYTLLDINPLLQYPDYALAALLELDQSETWHQELLAWWQHVYFALPPTSSFRNEVIMPIVSKMGLFQDNQLLRRVVGQPVTKAPVHLCITEGKIVLCALSSRDMEDAAVNVIGSTLINLLHRAFSRQQEIPLSQRRKVFCAADEFQAFSGGDFDRLLSEDAKFGCSLLLATQNLKRLNKIRDGLLEMVLSNCENLFAFNVSAADASILEEELREVVEQKHIISQPRLHCYARLSLPDHPQQIVSVALASPASWQRDPARLSQVQAIRQETRRHLAHASAIDQHYAEHLARFLDVTPFTHKVQREVRETQQQQQQRARAERLAQQVREDQHQQKAKRTPPSTSAPPSPQTAPPPENDGTPAAPASSLAAGSSAPQGAPWEESEGKRNHVRSKRKKYARDPVGVPPPPPIDPAASEQDTLRPRFPLRGLGGASFWKSERERGE